MTISDNNSPPSTSMIPISPPLRRTLALHIKASQSPRTIWDVSAVSSISSSSGPPLTPYAGAAICIFVGNPLGRRRTIFLGTCIMIVGAILQTTSYQLPQFIIGRLVTGLGNGLNTSTVPTWQSECSRSHRRGQLVMIEGALITCGIMIAYWIDFGLYFLDPNPVAWRFPVSNIIYQQIDG